MWDRYCDGGVRHVLGLLFANSCLLLLLLLLLFSFLVQLLLNFLIMVMMMLIDFCWLFKFVVVVDVGRVVVNPFLMLFVG